MYIFHVLFLATNKEKKFPQFRNIISDIIATYLLASSTHTHTHNVMHVYMYMNTYTHMHTHKHIYMYMNTCTHMHTHKQQTRTHTCTHIHSHTFTHTFTYTHTHTCRLQNERMQVLKKMLQQREVDHQALNDKRLEHLWYVIKHANISLG